MSLYEHPLLHMPDLMLAVLKVAARGPATLEDAVDEILHLLKRAHEDHDVTRAQVRTHLGLARRYLVEARLVERTGGDRFRITDRGRRVVKEHPMGVDESVLLSFPEFREYIHRVSEHPPVEYPAPPDRRAKEYQEGYIAYLSGRGADDNPYTADTVNHLAWENGWSEARDEDTGPPA